MILFLKYFSIFILAANIFENSFKEESITYSARISGISNNFKLSLIAKQNDSVISNDYLVFSNPVYNFKVIDINQDGIQDFCVGLIKTTRWNSVPKPKIHIYSHKNGVIYPIWRSSKIGNNLIDFDIDSTDHIPGIKILDNPNGKIYNIALYRWKSFGLKFVKYLHTDLDSLSAYKILRSEK